MGNASNKIWQEVRIFLRKISWKKILTFSFFVIIAAFLWFMQIYNQYFETSITIPIKYVSVPDSIIFQDSLPSQINLRIKDNGFSMFKYYFKRRDTLRLDVSAIINSSSSRVLQGSTFDMYVRKALPISTQILNYDPLRISFNYAILEHKKVPLVFDGQINLSPGYFLNSDIKITPDSVMAYGAKPDLDKLIFAYTLNDTVNGLNSDKELIYKLASVRGIKFVPDEVYINAPIEAYTQKNVEVAVECLNLPENLNVKFFPSKVKLSFFVGVSQVDSINYKDFSVAIDYDGIKDSRQVSVPVRITSSPSYVRNLTISPPNVEFIFEYKSTKIQ